MEFVEAVKIAFQARQRFWEKKQAIYGSISWTNQDITQICYPGNGYFAVSKFTALPGWREGSLLSWHGAAHAFINVLLAIELKNCPRTCSGLHTGKAMGWGHSPALWNDSPAKKWVLSIPPSALPHRMETVPTHIRTWANPGDSAMVKPSASGGVP